MLRSEDLALEGFDEILKSAKSEIPKIYPEWTNHNPSDPGITMLELLAYLAEVQRYRLNYIHKGHYLRYLKLLGKSPRGVIPSKTYLKLTGSGELPEKTLFYADNNNNYLPFETACPCTPDDNEAVSVQSGSEVLRNDGGLLSEIYGNTAFYPFGKNAAKKYPEFRIKTKNPVKPGSVIGIYFSIGHTGRFTAVRTKEEIPVTVSVNGCGILLDETMGFTASGVILIKVNSASGEIVFSVDSGEFTAMPIVTAVIMNVVPAYQRETLAYVEEYDRKKIPDRLMTVEKNGRRKILKTVEKITDSSRLEAVFLKPGFAGKTMIASARGLCGFRVRLDIPDILPDGLLVYVEEDDGIYKWETVSDFDQAGKLSRVCVYDSDTSELVFGDGRKGMPPRGDIYLFGCAVSSGADGNVKTGMVNSTDKATGISAVNILPSVGGSAPQTIDDCFSEVRLKARSPECCVTLEDCENAVLKASGVPDKRVKAFIGGAKENVICIAAECRIGSEDDSALMRNIRNNLLPRVLVGTKVEFPSVRYTGVNIFIEVSASLYYSDCKERTEKALRDYFNGAKVNFGDIISVNDISRYVCGLSWINAVRSVDLSVSASDGERLIGGDIRLKDVCLPVADKITVTIHN